MKRILAILLVVTMLLALTACGSSSSATESEVADSSTSETTETSESTETAETSEEADPVETEESAEPVASEDTEEPVVSEDADESATLQWPEEPLTLTMWTHANDGFYTDISVLDTNPCLVQAEEDTNIHLSVNAVARSAASEQFDLMIAAGEYPDLINRFVSYYTGSVEDAIDQEIIIDMADYMEEHAPNYMALAKADEDFYRDMKTDSGIVATMYAMTTYADGGPIAGGYIRQDWLDELGMEKPVTYDEYYEVLTAFKNTYGCSTALMLTQDIFPENYCLIAGYDTSSSFYNRDGTICYGPMEDGYKEFLTMLNQWYSEGLFSSDFLSIKGGMSNAYQDYMADGRTGMWFCMARQDDSWSDLLGLDATTAVTAIQDAVKNEDDQTHLGWAERLIGNDGISISTALDSELVPYAIQWMDYWYSEEGITMVNYGIEGLTYELDENGEPQYTDLIVNNPDGYSKVQAQFAYCLIHLVPSRNTAAQSIVSEDHYTWGINKDGSYELPTTLSMTVEESQTYTELYTTIETYVDEMTARFIVGESSLDEWDSYVETLKEMDIQSCIDIVQAEYDRYLER